jgi:acetylornithine deacetylase
MTSAYDILDRLIAFPSVSRDGNIDLIRYIADALAAAGVASRLFPHENGDRASLFATIGPEGPGGIVLSGHTDVVPVDGQAWTVDPFRMSRKGDRFYGRGTTDMKGFIACAMEAAVAATERRLTRPLHLALSYDEEIGCVGVRPMLDELATAGIDPEWVLIGEPTAMQVATGHKGKTGVKAYCTGHSAHSALAPTGLNAIYMAAELLEEVRAIQADIVETGPRDSDYTVPYTTLHAGVIQGGTALNIVPDACRLDFEIRNLAGDDPMAYMARLFDKAERITAEGRKRFPETGIRVDIFNTYPGLNVDPRAKATEAVKSLSGGSQLKVSFGTEGGLFEQAFGAPSIVCGPGDMEQGHKPDEFIELSQMEACRTMLGKILDRLS